MIDQPKPGKPRSPGADQRVVTAVDRAARVLLAFGQSWDFLSLPEVAARSGLSKPTGLGFLTLRLADVVLGGVAIRATAWHAMRRIRDQVNETVVLSIRQGDACYNVDSLDSTQSVGQAHAIGVAAPLHALAPGRALLASWPDDEIAGYLQRMRPPPKSKAGLWRDIESIRKRGYAVSSGELMRAGHTLARAIPGDSGAAAAALHISFPQSRFTRELERNCIEALETAVRDIRTAGD
jgi:IclR family acetate operon transcriptional repressor